MTFDVEVGGRTRNVEARGAAMFLDGQPVDVDVAKVGHAWSFIVGPAKAGHYENDVTSWEVVSGLSRTGLAPPKPQGGEGGRSYEVAVVEHAPGDLTVHVNGRPVAVKLSLVGRGGPQGPALREHGGPQGPALRTTRRAGARGEVTRIGPQRLLAPMPGRITRVLVKVGDAVAARQGLVVVEAMKMENELRSPRAGIVTEVPAVEGALVKAHAVLVVVE